MDDIEITEKELRSFDNVSHFNEWLLEMHDEYEITNIDEMKSFYLIEGFMDYYLSCKNFELNYLR